MKPTTHHRYKNHVVDVTQELADNTTYSSINKAKKESFKIQMKTDGALGRGSVALV